MILKSWTLPIDSPDPRRSVSWLLIENPQPCKKRSVVMNLDSLSNSIYYVATMNQVLCNSMGTMRSKADLDRGLVALSSWTSPDAVHALVAPFPHRGSNLDQASKISASQWERKCFRKQRYCLQVPFKVLKKKQKVWVVLRRAVTFMWDHYALKTNHEYLGLLLTHCQKYQKDNEDTRNIRCGLALIWNLHS